MAKQQLYINGVAVDMPAEAVKIKVASNILSNIGKVVTAHSYSVTLPRTTTNDSVFAMAYVVGADTGSSTTHTYLAASFHVDGVPLFEGGKAVLNSVDEKGYKINLFWGLLGAFDEIKREDLDLCDLPISEHWDESTMASWVQLHRYNGNLGEEMLVPAYVSGMDGDTYATLDTDSQTLAYRLPWALPYVGAGTILNKISLVYGITFDKSATFTSRLGDLYVPLTTLRALADGEKITGSLVGGAYDYKPDSTQSHWRHFINWMSATSSNGYVFDGLTRYGQSPNDVDPGTASAGWPGTYYVPVGGRVTFDTFRVHGTASRQWRLMIHPEWKDACTGATPVRLNSEQWYVAATSNGYGGYTLDVTFRDVTAQDWNLPYPDNTNDPWLWNDTPVVTLSADFTISDCSEDIVEIESYYSIDRNFPKVKVVDFLNELLAHCGAFVVGSVTKPDAIKIITFDEMAAATPIDLESYGVVSITMSSDGFAQRNIMEHKENDDDGLAYLAKGEFSVLDTTLDAETNHFTSKFKVPRTNLIKQWDITLNDDSTYSAKWVNAGDYVCGLDGVHLYNTGQDFNTILGRFYSAYKSMVRQPKIIEVAVRMGLLDLLNLDMARPLYIPQLASTFAIVELNSDGGDRYKLKLIKL